VYGCARSLIVKGQIHTTRVEMGDAKETEWLSKLKMLSMWLFLEKTLLTSVFIWRMDHEVLQAAMVKFIFCVLFAQLFL
jgi:hypothetical protein